jgi:hypothetical protein
MMHGVSGIDWKHISILCPKMSRARTCDTGGMSNLLVEASDSLVQTHVRVKTLYRYEEMHVCESISNKRKSEDQMQYRNLIR